jgi:hypothetical protein
LIPVVAFPLAGVISTVNVLFLLRLHLRDNYFHRMPCVTFYFTVNSTLGLVKIEKSKDFQIADKKLILLIIF